jgi:hypothetical protein
MYYLSGCPCTISLKAASNGEAEEQNESSIVNLARRFRKSLSTKSITASTITTSEHAFDTESIASSEVSSTREIGIDALLSGVNMMQRPGPLALRASPNSMLFTSWNRRSFCIWSTRVSRGGSVLLSKCIIQLTLD